MAAIADVVSHSNGSIATRRLDPARPSGTKLAAFSERYAAALDGHLAGHGDTTLRLARPLGREARELALDALDLAQAHESAVHEAASGHGIAATANTRRRAEAFLLAALTPKLEQAGVPLETNGTARAAQAAARRSTALLTAAHTALRRERARRRTAQCVATEADQRYQLLLTQSQRMQGQLRHLTQKVLTVQEDERRKISRELHDDVVQLLAGISVQLATLTIDVDAGGRTLQRKLARTRRLVEHSIEAVHRFARELRPAVLDDLGLLPALRSFVKGLRTTRRLNVHITAFPEVEALNKDKRTVLYRVTQEALTNIVRHAHATHVQVRLRREAQSVALEVEDNGVSFDVARVLASRSRKRLGLLGMRERMEMIGGHLEILSDPGQGTRVRALVPLSRREANSLL